MQKNYASLGKRFGAYLIDQIVYAMIVFVVMFVVGFVGLGNMPDILIAVLTVIIVVVSEYSFLTKMEGQTPGKKALKLRVVDADTLEPASNEAIRTRVLLLRPIPTLISFANIGFFYLLINCIVAERNIKAQTFWDSKANTVVIEEN